MTTVCKREYKFNKDQKYKKKIPKKRKKKKILLTPFSTMKATFR